MKKLKKYENDLVWNFINKNQLTTFVTYKLRRPLLEGLSTKIDAILVINDGRNDTVRKLKFPNIFLKKKTLVSSTKQSLLALIRN